MLLSVAEFRARVQDDMDGLARVLQRTTGRYSPSEFASWKQSLPTVANILKKPAFEELCIHIADKSHLSLEYRMPSAAATADLVLLGKKNGRPGAIILELKHWQTDGDRPGAYPGLMYHMNNSVSHPSDQVKGYVEYCRHFHSAVQKYQASVNGLVVFTKSEFFARYREEPNAALNSDYPCFSTRAHEDIESRLPQHILNLLDKPDAEFAQAFEHGKYSQSRNFVVQVSEHVQRPDNTQFVLLDHQRRAFAEIMSVLKPALEHRKKKRKSVTIVHGPPGSGKSIVAVQLWAEIVKNLGSVTKDVVICTTSASQRSNWRHMMDTATVSGASGVIRAATSYTPITTGTFGALRKENAQLFRAAEHWRENLHSLSSVSTKRVAGTRDNELFLSLVDEAHALINPEHSEGRGQHGFVGALGPQAYHIMRCSQHTVFFMDAEQGFRDQENTSLEDIIRFAQLLGVDDVALISLEDSQFRCAGSIEYINSIDSLLELTKTPELESSLLKVAEPEAPYLINTSRRFPVTVVDTPGEIDACLQRQISQGHSARLLASYAREWKTSRVFDPRSSPDTSKDFNIPYTQNGVKRLYAKIWNEVGDGGDYAPFVQGSGGSKMRLDPLAEVGCAYVVRGFDYDYIGLLWLSDLVWRSGRWQVNTEHVHETGIKRAVSAYRKSNNPDGPEFRTMLRKIQQVYRILLTRPIKGIYIWFEDPETRKHVEQKLQ